MKLIQKILSHGLLIAFLVAMFFLYQERTELFPQWFGKSAQRASAPVKVVKKTPAPAPAPVEPSPAATETAPVVTQQQPVMPSSADTTVAAPDKSAPVFRPLDGKQQIESSQAADTDTTVADAAAGSANVARPVMEQPVTEPDTAAVEQQSDPVTEPLAAAAPVITPPVAETTPADTLISQPDVEQAAVEPVAPAATPDPAFQSRLEQARSLFWQRNTRAALQAYRSLTADYPDSAQAWGELGNLYFNLRQAPAAASAYARAIDLLIAQGEFMRAHQLLGVMYRLDARQAQQLETRLRQAGG